MRILVVGTHPEVHQPSMVLFASWIADSVRVLGDVTVVQAPAAFLTAGRRKSSAAKWLAYFDQYLLLTLDLWRRHRRFDAVVVADHGNAPSAMLVPSRKLIVMVHDTIAMRQALGEVADAPRPGRGGAILQAVIRHSIRRARALLSNPGSIPSEIEGLGLGRNVYVVGCPADYSRLKGPFAASPVTPPYILNVASDGWRKRKRSLISLWSAIEARSNLKLVLAGTTDDETHQAFLGAGLKNIVVLNRVSNCTLASLYNYCEALISPSHEEGLCIPILEALCFEKHVFTTNVTPSYADFFGPAVTRINLEEPIAAAEQMIDTLGRSPNLEAVRQIKAWSEPSAFNARVVDALRKSQQANTAVAPAARARMGSNAA